MDKGAVSVSIIGGADGPTSIFTLKAVYYDAYHAARQEINSGIAGMEVQGGFDARA